MKYLERTQNSILCEPVVIESEEVDGRKDGVYFTGSSVKFWPVNHAPGAGSRSSVSFPAQNICRRQQLAEPRNDIGIYQCGYAGSDFRVQHAPPGGIGSGEFDVWIFFSDCLYCIVYNFRPVFFQLLHYWLPDFDAMVGRTCGRIFRLNSYGCGQICARCQIRKKIVAIS